jgi:hypothetical protein
LIIEVSEGEEAVAFVEGFSGTSSSPKREASIESSKGMAFVASSSSIAG